MQGTRTIRTALALVATLGVVGTLAAGCGNGSAGGSSETTTTAAAQSGGTMIDSFEGGNASGWTPFMTGGSSISSASAPLHADGASTSTEITYSVVTGGSAGLERDFSTPQDWSASSALTLWVYGRSTGHSFLVQVYDAGHERWESRFPVNFSGWQQITIPFSGLTAASWQPPTATVDGVRDFSGVTGMALAPSDGVGSGVVNLDMLALGTASSDATAPSGTADPTAPTTAPVNVPTPTAGSTTAPTTSPTAPTTTPVATPTAAPSPTPTATPATPDTTPTATPVATPTATPVATPTAAPTPAATPVAAPAPAASGAVTGTIIPLYTAPTDPSWAAVAAAKAAHPAVPVLAVVNPANGPGAAASADYSAGIARLTAAGVKVIGYVHTSWGARPAAELQAEMGQWQSWYPGVSGIFFDEMANAAGQESYYSALTAYAKGRGLGFTIGNPGADSSPTYVGTEDVILIYENSGVPSVAALGGWHASYNRSNFGVIPYAVGSLDTTFVQAAKPYVAYIYLQSDTLPNPWDSVPPYLSELVASLD
ncbi:MAG TPA: spherulation-specific family 4 protein [Polyangia bacterium]|nr:spherulation-specific family 4 protein [Polyangia bacterium]